MCGGAKICAKYALRNYGCFDKNPGVSDQISVDGRFASRDSGSSIFKLPIAASQAPSQQRPLIAAFSYA